MNYDEQEKIIAQQRAKYLRQQDTQAPEGRMVGGRYVAANPLEYLAAGLRGYGGFKGEQQANQELTDLQSKKQQAMQGDMSAMLSALRGKPAETVQPLTPNDDEGNVNPPVQMPAQAGGVDQFYQAAMKSQFPQFQQMGMQGMMQMPQLEAQQKEREDARAFRQQEAQAARDARAEELQMRMQDQRASQAEKLQAQRELQQMQIDARKDMQRMIAASRPAAQAPNAQTLQTENGILERRGNEWVPITVGGKPVMPKGTGANAVLPEVAKAKDATDAMALLQQAAPLVRGATGSGIGAGVDWLAGQVGKATSGAENIAQLKTIAGMLVSKMPKMTGPQSDKDVMLYKEMAGNIGDPSVPTPLKEKAMQTIMEIQARYANTPAPTLDFTGAPQKQANPQDSQAMEWARSNPNDPRAKAIMQRLGGQ